MTLPVNGQDRTSTTAALPADHPAVYTTSPGHASPTIFLVIPTYNEAVNMAALLRRLLDLPLSLRILVVDDSSPDGTAELVERISQQAPSVGVLRRPRKEGLGSAIRAGLERALASEADYVALMDGDGSHDPGGLVEMVRAATLCDADGVVGSRYIAGGDILHWPRTRLFLSRTANWLTRQGLRLSLSDMTSGYQLYKRDVLRRAQVCRRVLSDGYAFQIELKRLLLHEGFRLIETPIVFTDRIGGHSKLTFRHIVEAAGTLARLTRRSREEMGLQRFPNSSDSPSVLLKHLAEPQEPPTVSIIVPAPPGTSPDVLCRAIRMLEYPADRYEVLIAYGGAPPRQRNLAARRSVGEVLYFLDSDTQPAPDALSRLTAAYGRDAGLGAAGGPSLAPDTISPFQRTAQAVMASALHGPCRARYAGAGRPRQTTERELILCHLTVSRGAWTQVGPFREDMRCNEECEWLNRAQRAGFRLRYDPASVVWREPRRTWSSFVAQFVKYGRGRGTQCRVEGWSTNRIYLSVALSAVLLGTLGVLRPSGLLWAGAAYMAAVCWSCAAGGEARSIGSWLRFLCAAAVMHAAYLFGLFHDLVRRPRGYPERMTADVRVVVAKPMGVDWPDESFPAPAARQTWAAASTRSIRDAVAPPVPS